MTCRIATFISEGHIYKNEKHKEKYLTGYLLQICLRIYPCTKDYSNDGYDCDSKPLHWLYAFIKWPFCTISSHPEIYMQIIAMYINASTKKWIEIILITSHWEKLPDILKYFDVFSWIKYCISLPILPSFLVLIKLTKCHYWHYCSSQWYGAKQAKDHYLNQCWHMYMHHWQISLS